jgi:hypothetical protein
MDCFFYKFSFLPAVGLGWLAVACRCVRSLSAGCAQPGAIILSIIYVSLF